MAQGIKNKYGPWVSGEDFFDRDNEIKRLTALIDEGNNILVVAPRRVGKTSLIRETFRRLDDKDAGYHLFVHVQDCSYARRRDNGHLHGDSPYTLPSMRRCWAR